jgi:hypothetical protein
VITHIGKPQMMVEMPWLESEYHIDESDWMILSEEGWRAVADGEPAIWDALERKLLIGFYVSQPQIIAVIGHPPGAGASDAVEERQAQVRRIVQRIRTLMLPSGVLGLWTDEDGALLDVLEPSTCSEAETPLQLMH